MTARQPGRDIILSAEEVAYIRRCLDASYMLLQWGKDNGGPQFRDAVARGQPGHRDRPQPRRPGLRALPVHRLPRLRARRQEHPVTGPAAPPLPAELDALLGRMRLPYLSKAAPDVLATARAQR